MSVVEKLSGRSQTQTNPVVGAARRVGALISAAAQDPFFQFIALGLVIWLGVETWQAHRRQYDIHVSQAELQRLGTIYFQQFGQWPGPVQQHELVDRYVREEISVREAFALRLDKDDEIIRRRMVQKYEFLQSDLTVPERPTPAMLQSWFDQNRQRYATPERLSFAHIYFSADHDGDDAARQRASKALATLERLRAVTAPDLGDSFPGPTDVSALGAEEADRLFGRSELTEQLFKLPTGRWSGPFRSGFGWHLVYVSARIPAATPPLDEIRDRVLADYMDEQRRRSNEQAYERLRAKYRVITDEARP